MVNKNHTYHTPVLLKESIGALKLDPEGVYADVTFGGGGHSKSILQQLSAKGRLFGFDQDKRAESNIVNDSRFVFVRANFQYITHFMRYYKVETLHGILADLGVSSYHFDTPERGFSYRFDTELDMRMNQSSGLTAKHILKKYSQEKLQAVFSKYGELRNAKTFSRLVCQQRQVGQIEKVSDLMALVDKVYWGDRQKYASQVFQALRIEVNDEIGTLRDFLNEAMDLLAPQGRLVVISYHSLEDKLVKEEMKKRSVGDTDEMGRRQLNYKLITRKPILPQEEEIRNNSRAASAKLRVIEKV